jgi:hypothetical protein
MANLYDDEEVKEGEEEGGEESEDDLGPEITAFDDPEDL